MKLHPEALIEKACSQDATRPTLQTPYLTNGKIYATDGKILAIIPHADPADTPGPLPIAALKTNRKQTAGIDLSDTQTAVMPDGQRIPRADKDAGTFPNCEQVLPRGEVKWSITFDPELLQRLADAMGASRGVTLEFCESTDRVVRVRPHVNNNARTPKGARVKYEPAYPDAVGVLMLIRTEDAP